MTVSLPDWPDFGLSDDIRPALAEAVAAGRPAALVTLFSVEGGGPRPPGTQMLIADGIVSGFLSGGCVEGDVVGHAARTLEDGEPRILVYGEGGPWPDIRLLCGARIELLVEKIEPDDPAALLLLELWRERRPALYISDGRRRQTREREGPAPLLSAEGNGPIIRRRYDPTQKLIVVGGDPTALAIAQLGAQSGMETALVRPKGPASPPPVKGLSYYRRDDPVRAFGVLGVDAWTAIAIATHDADTDHEALVAALPSPAGYVGLLGARRRLPDRVVRLRAAGIAPQDIARMIAPIGLDLGGKAPWEVAVAVIGEIIAERREPAPAED